VTTCDTLHSFEKKNLNKLDIKDGIVASPTKPFSTPGISDIILLISHFETSVFKKTIHETMCWLNFPCHIFYKESRKNKWKKWVRHQILALICIDMLVAHPLNASTLGRRPQSARKGPPKLHSNVIEVWEFQFQ
jgi:hypothetical protein